MLYFLIYLVMFFAGYIVFYNIKVRDKILGWKNSRKSHLSKRGRLLLCLFVYVVSVVLFSFLIKSIVTVIAVSILPLIGVYSVVDISQRYMEDRELKQITLFLMTMAKWSGVKNDLVYCLKKTCETGMKKPMGRIIDTALGRIYGGMPPVAAFGLMEKEASSEDFRYLVKNIRFAAEKGGNLQLLFKGMEEQYFKIEEEYFKRKISTLRDRVAVYLTIFMVITTGIWFIGSNPAASAYYLNTVNGNLMLLAFVVIFGFGIMIMMKR